MATRQKKEEWHRAVSGRIRALRKAKGMTQEQLSEKAGIASQYLSRLETARQVPSLDTIVDLAQALHTPLSALLGEPQQDTQAERASRVAAMLATLSEEDATFLETQVAGWMSHLKSARQTR